MPKLRAQKYRHADGTEHVNCYNVSIPRRVAESAGITSGDELRVKADEGRIIVERAANENQDR